MWSRKFDKCTNCGTTDIKHIAKGLCKKCYNLNIESEHKKHTRHHRGVAEDFLTKDKLIELYVVKRMSLTDIGRIAGCTRVNVHYKLKRFGIKARSKTAARTLALDQGKIKTTRIDEFGDENEITYQKIRYNENFFKVWSSEMAYVLGLIYTDGNLHIRKYKSGYQLGILAFAQKDKELVEKFLQLMDCDAKIRFKKRKEFKNTTAGELYYFSIGNNDIANDLMQLGITPDKSLNMKFPEIPNEFIRHYIRGLFDGDGSIFLDRGKYVRVVLLSGSKEFMVSMNDKLFEAGFPLRKIYGGYQYQKHAFYIRYISKKDVVAFYDFLYKDVSMVQYYSKKHQKFIDYLQI